MCTLLFVCIYLGNCQLTRVTLLKTQFHSKGKEGKAQKQPGSDLSLLFVGQSKGEDIFCCPPSIDSALRPTYPGGPPHKKCPCNSHCVVLWRVANYRNIVRHSEWSEGGGSHLFSPVSTPCCDYLVVGHSSIPYFIQSTTKCS